MALTVDKKEFWEGRLAPYLDSLSVYKQALCNSRYEGKVELNNTLHIISVSDVSESEYTGAWVDGDYSAAATTEETFTVDQKRKFLINVKDTDQMGSVVQLIDQGSQRAAYAVVNRQDQWIASLHSQIDAANAYGDDTTPITIGFGVGEIRPLDALTMLRERLAESKAPMTDPRVVIPIWFSTMLIQQIGARNTNAGDAAMQNGIVQQQGLVAKNHGGFNQIWASANVPNAGGAKYKVLCGDAEISFANAIQTVETARAQNDFATLVKGLYVYGGKILYGEMMGLGTFNKGSYQHEV